MGHIEIDLDEDNMSLVLNASGCTAEIRAPEGRDGGDLFFHEVLNTVAWMRPHIRGIFDLVHEALAIIAEYEYLSGSSVVVGSKTAVW